MLKQIYLGIGSNLKRRENIRNSIRALRSEFPEIEISNIYQSKAVGFSGNDFYNLVVGFKSDIKLESLTNCIKSIEDANGRQRSAEKFSDRTIDIDVLLYGDAILYDAGFDIPRKEIIKYPFVLKPLAEIAPDFVHPVSHKTIKTMWKEFKEDDKMILLDESDLELN